MERSWFLGIYLILVGAQLVATELTEQRGKPSPFGLKRDENGAEGYLETP